MDSVHPAPRPSGVLAVLVRPNRLSCRFVEQGFLPRSSPKTKWALEGPFGFGGAASPLRTTLSGHSDALPCYVGNLQEIRQLSAVTREQRMNLPLSL